MCGECQGGGVAVPTLDVNGTLVVEAHDTAADL